MTKKPKAPKDQGNDEAEESFAELLQEFSWNPDKAESTHSGLRPLAQKPKKSQQKVEQIDLHGLTLEEAKAAVDRKISGLALKSQQGAKLRIITGKGRHSPNSEGLLIRAIYDHVAKHWQSYLQSIDSPPGNDLLQGLPIRGHFDIVLK